MENDRLDFLISDSGVMACRFEDGRYNVTYAGRLRPWDISVWLSNGWTCLRTTLLPLPTVPGLRSEMLAAALTVNDRVSMAKIALAWENTLTVDAQVRIDHLTGTDLTKAIELVHWVAETNYARLVEIASGSGMLAALETAFERTPATQ